MKRAHTVMRWQESLDTLEENALAQPVDANIASSVFSTKRELSALGHALWSQQVLILRVRDGVIPLIDFLLGYFRFRNMSSLGSFFIFLISYDILRY